MSLYNTSARNKRSVLFMKTTVWVDILLLFYLLTDIIDVLVFPLFSTRIWHLRICHTKHYCVSHYGQHSCIYSLSNVHYGKAFIQDLIGPREKLSSKDLGVISIKIL